MNQAQALAVFAALSQDTRLRIVRLLVTAGPKGLPAGAIGAAMDGSTSSRMSFHLGQLETAGLLRSRRDGRQVIYSVALDALSGLIGFLMRDCCQSHPEICAPPLLPFPASANPKRRSFMSEASARVFNVLFLCTGNSARSIIAESLLNQEGGGRFRAFSAGSQPKGDVHPTALKVLTNFHYPVDGLRSKSWDEFAAPHAPVMDFVFTVCDNAAGEVCPYWPGQPMTAHWGIADPAAATGTDLEREMAFIEALRYMKTRIAIFAALSMATLDRSSLAAHLHEIGQGEGATIIRPVVA